MKTKFSRLLFAVLLCLVAFAGVAGAASEPAASGSSGSDIFGNGAGYVHPFVAASAIWTDNYFNDADNEDSELTAVLSPGIWVSLPGSRQQLLSMQTSNTNAGGFSVSRFQAEDIRKFQAYGLYRADLEENRDNRDNESTRRHRGEGLLQFNLSSGLSLELLDVYEQDLDDAATGEAAQREEFKSNLFNATLNYRISPKFRLRADYTRYDLEYQAVDSQFRNRTDDGFSLYAFYKALPKTAIFVEYSAIDIDYDRASETDSDEQRYYLGLQLDGTGKTQGRIKLGYGDKSFSGSSQQDQTDIIAEVQVSHDFTPKTAVTLIGSYLPNETTSEDYIDMMSTKFALIYSQALTAKLTLTLNGAYIEDDFRGADIGTPERTDEYLSGGLALGYDFTEQLGCSLGYSYTDRSSTLAEYRYDANLVFFSLSAAF